MNEMFDIEIGSITITREDIQRRLEKININKSCGPDNIHPFVLQSTAKAVSIPLRHIFSKSIYVGECPADWKSANVTPIHKKGDRKLPTNYRPVSLTSQVCKVLESIVREHLLKQHPQRQATWIQAREVMLNKLVRHTRHMDKDTG